MAGAVPAADLPKNAVPKNDLPGPQEKSGFPEKAAAFGYGAVTGLIGSPGDIEEFVTQTVPKLFGASKGLYDASTVIGDESKTFLPTTEQVRQTGEHLGIPRPAPEMSGYETAGELAPAALALPKLAQKGIPLITGESSKIGEESAKLAEKLGFKLSAQQVARAAPTTQRGAAGFAKANQKLANRLVSEATGKPADFVDEKFLRQRIKDLGKDFDAIYHGKTFTIDPQAIQAVQQIAANEAAALGPSGVSAVKSAADDLLKAGNRVPGELVQRLRNALTARAGSTGGQAAHEIYSLVDEIDASVARNHPQVAKELDRLRPKYRAAVVLEDLTRQGGINRGDVDLYRMGRMLEGTAIRRKTLQDIDLLGQVGRDNRLISMAATPGEAAGEELSKAASLAHGLGVSKVLHFAGAPLRSRAVRAAQRFMSHEPSTTVGRYVRGQFENPLITRVAPAGVVSRAANPSQEEP